MLGAAGLEAQRDLDLVDVDLRPGADVLDLEDVGVTPAQSARMPASEPGVSGTRTANCR